MVSPALTFYSVAVVYYKNGNNQQYSGSFRGHNAAEAAENARNFVIKYIRPNSITDVALSVANFTTL